MKFCCREKTEIEKNISASHLGADPMQQLQSAGLVRQKQDNNQYGLTTVVPSGDCARCSTREVWPVNSATLTMEGYFHSASWF
jgi:hypothetical protein